MGKSLSIFNKYDSMQEFQYFFKGLQALPFLKIQWYVNDLAIYVLHRITKHSFYMKSHLLAFSFSQYVLS